MCLTTQQSTAKASLDLWVILRDLSFLSLGWGGWRIWENPLSGNSSDFFLSRANERSSFTSVISWFMLLYWIYEFFPFDQGPAVGFTRAGPRFRVIISISQPNICIIYAIFSRASYVSWDSVLPGNFVVAIHDLKYTLWRWHRIFTRNTRSSELIYTSR